MNLESILAKPKPPGFLMPWDEFAPCVMCGGTWFKFTVGFEYVVKFCRKDGVGIVINPIDAKKYLAKEQAPALGT